MEFGAGLLEGTESPYLHGGSPQGYTGGGDPMLAASRRHLSELLNVTMGGVGELLDNLTTANLTLGDEGEAEMTKRDTAACITFKFVLYAVAMGVLCVLGFTGNTLSFLVLRKDLSTPVASFLLEMLAMADNVLLVLWLVHYSLRESFNFFGLTSNIHDAWMYVRVYTFPVMYMAQMATIWLTVVIALNRYMAVCLPYRAPHLCNINNVYKGVAAVVLFSVFYNLPRFFEIQIIHGVDANGTAETTWKRTALGSNKIYDQVYVDAFYYLFSFVLPLLTLAFVNTRVTIAYQAIRRRKQRMTSRRQENENNITLVMIIIVLIFMLCQAPARIVQIVWGYQYKHCHTYQFYLIHISNTLEVLNSSVNFVVYFMFRKRFRDIVWANFCVGPLARLHRRRQGPQGGATTTEGLSLVQIEQTTATMMHDACVPPAGAPSNKPPMTFAPYKDKDAGDDLGVRQPLNGTCTKGGGQEDEEGGVVGAGEAGEREGCPEVTPEDVANGVAEPCLLHNNNEEVLEDGAHVPLRP